MNKSNELPYFKQTTSKEKKGGVGMMETNYEKIIENIIGSLVNESVLNSNTYSEAKLYISKRVSHNELGSMIKKIAHDKIEYLAMNSKING